ncbi:MAG: EAL domain-containing protein [Xanthomonadales bacterium]|nr:EAL domain-containing protein [Xanthomonadales bacterium]
MKRWREMALVAVFGSMLAAPLPAAPTPGAPARIRVVADGEFPPFLFTDSEGRLRGYSVDAWRLFEERSGIRVELTGMDWMDAQAALQSGRADVIEAIYRTPGREASYAFTPGFATSSHTIYAHRRVLGVTDVASLRGFPVGVQEGNACAEVLQSLGVTDLRSFPTYAELVDAAVGGRLRIFCMEEHAANWFLYRKDALDRFSSAFTLRQTPLHRATRKGDTAMLALVEEGMARLTVSDRAVLEERWLRRPVLLAPYLRSAAAALGIFIVLAIAALAWVWSLRRSVARRTRELHAEQAKLRALLDASPDALWVRDRDGVMLDCNDRVAEILGDSRSALIGRHAADILGGEHAAGVDATEEEVLRDGVPQVSVFSRPARDGSVRHHECIKVALRGSGGAIDGTLTVARDITERLQTQMQLRMWAHAFEHAAFAVAIYDVASERVIAANSAFARERGYASEELVGMDIDVLYPPGLQAQLAGRRRQSERVEHSVDESVHLTRDGRSFPVLLNRTLFRDSEAGALYAIVYARDISESRRTESELRLAAAAFETQDAALVMDEAGMVQRINDAFTALTGYEPHEIIGKPPSMLVSRNTDKQLHRSLWGRVREQGSWRGELWIETRDAGPKVVRTALSAVSDGAGGITHYVGAFSDMTAEREAHASVDRITFFDPLTELPNRSFLLGRLHYLLDAAQARGGALLLFDFDHFKQVNDLRGHTAGDRLVVQVAGRLRALYDPTDDLCRVGGGTFALVLAAAPDSTGPHDTDDVRAAAAAARLREALRAPFALGPGESPATITVSIGWTVLVPGRGSPEAVLGEAELAMYDAKAHGRDRASRFKPAMLVALAERESLVEDLRRAAAASAFALHLQPQVDRKGTVIGAEALLRWRRPGGEEVSPEVFVPLAEERGLIDQLGDWVLRRACARLIAWAADPDLRELAIAINVSARQFASPGFVGRVRQALLDSGANPARLQLEITESVTLGDLDLVAERLASLRSLGIRILLDDFGTGYSSLSYLARLPLDFLKVDRSFVARLPDADSDSQVALAIIDMGHRLGLKVIAEGVETAAQHAFLLARGCNHFQGFLFGRPVPEAEFEPALAAPLTPAEASPCRAS